MAATEAVAVAVALAVGHVGVSVPIVAFIMRFVALAMTAPIMKIWLFPETVNLIAVVMVTGTADRVIFYALPVEWFIHLVQWIQWADRA